MAKIAGVCVIIPTVNLMRDALAVVLARYDAYRARPISMEIGDCDDAFARHLRRTPKPSAHYVQVGRSAIDLLP